MILIEGIGCWADVVPSYLLFSSFISNHQISIGAFPFLVMFTVFLFTVSGHWYLPYLTLPYLT